MEAFVNNNPKHQAICLTETWLSQNKLNMIHFNGYKIAASYCRRNRGGGGVCILLDENKEHIERKEISEMSIEYIIEVCATELPKENLLIITIYWNRREEEIFYHQLTKILTHVNKKFCKSKLIIGGDLNIDILKNNLKTNTFLDLMSEYKLTQHIKDPTHITQTTSTCLDLIFTNFNTKDLHTHVREIGFSDHCGTILTFNIPQQQKILNWYTKKRTYNATNINKFKLELTTVNWNDIITKNKDIDQNYNAFNNKLQTILNKTIPKQKVKQKKNCKKYWLTKGIKLSCKNKRLLKILTIKINNPIINKYYKNYEKILKLTVNKAKKLHYINKIKMSQNKTKTMWNIIHERTNKKSNRDHHNIQLQINNSNRRP